jgi:hypothetical protein
MENRYSWRWMAVALFDTAAAKLGDDARQLQDAMFWLRGGQARAAEPNDTQLALAPQGDTAQR